MPHFGSTQGMAYLDPSFRRLSVYMGILVKALEDKGYIDGASLLGAPYDFRYIPGEHAAPIAATFLEDLRGLIERAYISNGEQPVVLLSHSLGGLWALYFLNQQTLSWRHKYVRRFIAVSAPWGGTVQEMRTYASGYSEGVPLIDPLILRAEQRSSESNLWLLPVPAVFGNRLLVISKLKNYSAYDIPEFLEDIGYSEGVSSYNSRIPQLVADLKAPGIPSTLIYSSGIKTPETLIYAKSGFDEQPKVIHGDGDGTVNLCSLSAVAVKWGAIEGQSVKVIEIDGKTHTTILTDLESVELMVSEIMGEQVLSAYS